MGLRKFSRFTIAIGKDADIGQTRDGGAPFLQCLDE